MYEWIIGFRKDVAKQGLLLLGAYSVSITLMGLNSSGNHCSPTSARKSRISFAEFPVMRLISRMFVREKSSVPFALKKVRSSCLWSGSDEKSLNAQVSK